MSAVVAWGSDVKLRCHLVTLHGHNITIHNSCITCIPNNESKYIYIISLPQKHIQEKLSNTIKYQ